MFSNISPWNYDGWGDRPTVIQQDYQLKRYKTSQKHSLFFGDGDWCNQMQLKDHNIDCHFFLFSRGSSQTRNYNTLQCLACTCLFMVSPEIFYLFFIGYETPNNCSCCCRPSSISSTEMNIFRLSAAAPQLPIKRRKKVNYVSWLIPGGNSERDAAHSQFMWFSSSNSSSYSRRGI